MVTERLTGDLLRALANDEVSSEELTAQCLAVIRRCEPTLGAFLLLDDEGALKQAAWIFDRVFVLDPFYDTGALLYAAWHDPIIKDEHSRMLAEQAGWLVRVAPLLNDDIAVLAPDHLPGSWTPRPGWRKPRPTADRRQRAGWSMRSGLVLLYWADRLGAVACATRSDVIASVDVALGASTRSSAIELPVSDSVAHCSSRITWAENPVPMSSASTPSKDRVSPPPATSSPRWRQK